MMEGPVSPLSLLEVPTAIAVAVATSTSTSSATVDRHQTAVDRDQKTDHVPSVPESSPPSLSSSASSTDLQMRIRRARSVGNLEEYRTQLQRFGGFVWELPGRLRSQHRLLARLPRRRAAAKAAADAVAAAENKLGDIGPQLPVDPGVLAVCMFPFVPLMLYALFTVALSTIVLYLCFLFLYLLVLGGTIARAWCLWRLWHMAGDHPILCDSRV